jgi:hypothetical protein
VTQALVNVGVVAGDGTGDSGQVPFNKTNANFSDLYGKALFVGTDSGVAGAYVIAANAFTPLPAAAIALSIGMTVTFTALNANPGASTLNFAGTGALAIVDPSGAALDGAEIQTTAPTAVRWNGAAWQMILTNTPALIEGLVQVVLTQSYLGAILYPQTPAELALSITPSNTVYPTGSLYRYGAKGGAKRVADAIIIAGSAVVTSASGGFAGAVAGMVFVVVDGAASRTGGRPAPLITTILSVQSANQVTLNATVTQPGTVTMNGTLNGTTAVTSTSVSPITAGVGLTRIWYANGVNIPTNDQVIATSSSTLTLGVAATGSGVSAITLTATIEAAFGYDDSTAILDALSLPYPIQDVTDSFLVTQTLPMGGAGCNDIRLPNALIIFAINNNTSHCITAVGFDRQVPGPYPQYLATGLRYLPFKIDIGEIDCCNSGLDGFSLGPSTWSRARLRVTNPFRNALGEFFLSGGWQESNTVEINCGQVGLHFHHKVNKSSTYQNLGSYWIAGRACGLNSVYLGINAGTQPDQCGGAIRLYCGGVGTGISQNVWGGSKFCEMDGERTTALSFGSDICNSPVTFVDATADYVIEGAHIAGSSNHYINNTFGNLVIEDITQTSDTRGGYQFYVMTNALVQGTNVLQISAGPWGNVYANPLMLNGVNNWVRSVNMSLAGYFQLTESGSSSANTLNLINGGTATPSLSIGGPIGISGNTPPAQLTGWGTPVGGAAISNYNITDAGGANSNTNKAVAEIIAYLKSRGDFAA